MIELSNLDDNYDIDKILHQNKILKSGLENYLKFQNYPNFRWPAWIETITNRKSNNFRGLTPPFLINNILCESVFFSNLLSNDEIYVDPSGMLSVSYGTWSIEFWVLINENLFRPQDELNSVRLTRDSATSAIETTWENKLFLLKQSIYGARSNIDEAVVEINCMLNTPGRDAYLTAVLRPYNNNIIGGLMDAEFNKATRLMKINGKKHLAFDEKPSFIHAGSGKDGDINFGREQDVSGISCKKGMTTIALGYKLKKGSNLFNLRVSLDRNGELAQGKISFDKLRGDFIEFSKFRTSSGMNINTPDKIINGWFYSSKSSLLNIIDRDVNSKYKPGVYDYKSLYSVIFGYNRMGYTAEAKKFIDIILNNQINEKNINFDDAINVCYMINSFTDYFSHTRDLDFLQLNYPDRLKKIGAYLYKYAISVKKISDIEKNTIDGCFIKSPCNLDFVILAFALNQLAYLARCLGIFDDEKKYFKEFERIENIFLKYLDDYEKIEIPNEFFYYDIFSSYPFRLENINNDKISFIVDKIIKHFDLNLLYNKSLGFDIIPSIIFASNLILLKDSRSHKIINELFKYGGEKMALPEFINPLSGKGCAGSGCSKIISSLIFAMIRNLIFVDNKERLDIFPIPLENWFKPGIEIRVDDAPSRFGKINFNVKTTTNEIHFYFDKLPKYIPPDIMINLPFKAELVEGDDFILKKVINNSFIINGWPSNIRFQKISNKS